MEMRAYLEGMGRRWWLFLLMIILAVWVGSIVVKDTVPLYTASTTILLNDKVLSSAAFSNSVIQIDTPATYVGKVESPAIFARVMQSYPRMTQATLQKNVVVSLDGTQQLMLITMTDASPFATADVANYLARHFVDTQTANLQHQLNYYNQWLTQQIASTQTDANQLSNEISTLAPQRAFHSPPPTLTPGQQITLSSDQSKLDQDNRTLYQYQQSLAEVQQVLPIINNAYVIVKPAVIPDVPNTTPLSPNTIELISVAVALFLTMILCVILDFFMPAVRHRREMQRVAQVPVLAEVPQLFQVEQERLLRDSKPLFAWRIKQLRLLCASLSASAIKKQGHTVLLTSSHKRRLFAPIVAMFLARKGLRTLLIDANFGQPVSGKQPSLTGPASIQTPTGHMLTFISKTNQPNLFFLPSTATISQGQPINETLLMEMLPELQRTFDIILIDGKPMDTPETHQLVTKVSQVLMLVKKRHDSLKELKKTVIVCDMLKADTRYVLLA